MDFAVWFELVFATQIFAHIKMIHNFTFLPSLSLNLLGDVVKE